MDDKKKDVEKKEVKKQDAETKEVQKADTNVPETVPGRRVSGDKPAGYEEADVKQDIIIPRISIGQGLSGVVIDKKCHAGDIYNSLSKEVYGEEYIFVPLFLFKTRIKFVQGKGAVCMSRNALQNGFSKLGEKDEEGKDFGWKTGTSCADCADQDWEQNKEEGPPCALIFNFLALPLNNLNAFPVTISCMKTALKKGKELLSMAAETGEDMFSRSYKMVVKQKDEGKGIFFIPVFELNRRLTDEEYAITKQQYIDIRGKKFDVHTDDISNDFESNEVKEGNPDDVKFD